MPCFLFLSITAFPADCPPGVVELCNGLDDDCDGVVDDVDFDGDGVADRRDQDGDGFGVLGACGFDPRKADCDDDDPLIYPAFNGELDRGNSADDDCDGLVDEDDAILDDDGDRFPEGPAGDLIETVGVCGPDPDGDPARNPGLLPDEVAPDGVDNDCQSTTGIQEDTLDYDEDDLTPAGGDCDDRDGEREPGDEERDNGLDDDCDGLLPESEWPLARPDLFPVAPADVPEECNRRDDDGDGLVDEDFDRDRDGVTTCARVPDCDDDNAYVFPGHPEWCGDGVDNDCAGGTEADIDGDGDQWGLCDGDPDDADPTRHPSAAERCDGRDDNGDGRVDEGLDLDGDGWLPCAGDCDDADAGVHPGAIERCNERDDDCDGLVDDAPQASAEDCLSGEDEDCDGLVDLEDEEDCLDEPPTSTDPDPRPEPQSPTSAPPPPRSWFCGVAAGEAPGTSILGALLFLATLLRRRCTP